MQMNKKRRKIVKRHSGPDIPRSLKKQREQDEKVLLQFYFSDDSYLYLLFLIERKEDES